MVGQCQRMKGQLRTGWNGEKLWCEKEQHVYRNQSKHVYKSDYQRFLFSYGINFTKTSICSNNVFHQLKIIVK